ncbi:MAG: ABC transporter substrate-binding protein [Actinomycetota bacterium]|jgi:ABC-type glycerol-3-phosphate transport system substrate-binding protein|nr:ABC transporter substrate-binding protein [Actinomycetota bacterium]
MKKASIVRRLAATSAVLALAAMASTAGLASASRAAPRSAPSVTLTLWQNYGTEANATATKNLVKAFEASHPTIKINVVAQPASNYFSLLQAAAISRTGPDLAVMWTGLYTLQYKSYLQNLASYVPKSDLARMTGLRWTAPGFNTASGSYVIPLEDQFYIGFYNKTLFAKAHVSQVPTNWSQLYQDCAKFKAAGITCLYYGAGSQNLGAEFYPYYDLSYLMIGALSLKQWQGLYSGAIPWTSPVVTSQLAKWQKLYTSGYTNKDVVTSIGSLNAFERGKAAMLIKGNWDLAQLYGAMGKKLGTFVPPFTDTKMHGVVQFPGDGYAMTSYSQHKTQAAEFLKFLTTPQAGRIVAASGLIPDVSGVSTSNPVSQQMLAFSAVGHLTQYPMLDNVTQIGVVNAGSKVLPQLLAGQLTPKAAASQLEQAWKQLPAGQRGKSWGSYSAG